MADRNRMTVPPVSVKTEPGSYKRLPSFRSPRDLKLTEFKQSGGSALLLEGKAKKVYIPNLNIQRKKHAEEPVTTTNNDSSATNIERGSKSERGKGREKKPLNLIQGAGVFSEGFSCVTKSSRWSGKNHSSTNNVSTLVIPKPKLNLIDVKVDKEEEELVMKELMRDDFMDDPELKPDFTHCPIQLPLSNFEPHFLKKEGMEQSMQTKDLQNINGIKVKSEFSTPEVKKEEKPRDIRQMKPLTVQELLLKSSENTFIFLQLPSCMPGPKIKIKQEFMDVESAGSSKTSTASEETQGEERTVLRTLPPGRIGTLQILKSGRARLVLGDAKLWIEPGTQASFKQDLMSIPLSPSTLTGNMINLGPITTRMIISPDWESMFKK